jgi:predicted molibdopterin-dependent oxidoreductase YjgC
MKDIPTLQGGSNLPTAMMHPADVAAISVSDGSLLRVSSEVGSIDIPVLASDSVMQGCICIPHGWSDFNVNTLVSTSTVDPFGGTAVLSGIPVSVCAAGA